MIATGNGQEQQMAATVATATIAAKQHNLGKVTASTKASKTVSAIAAGNGGRQLGEVKATGDWNGRDGNRKKQKQAYLTKTRCLRAWPAMRVGGEQVERLHQPCCFREIMGTTRIIKCEIQ